MCTDNAFMIPHSKCVVICQSIDEGSTFSLSMRRRAQPRTESSIRSSLSPPVRSTISPSRPRSPPRTTRTRSPRRNARSSMLTGVSEFPRMKRRVCIWGSGMTARRPVPVAARSVMNRLMKGYETIRRRSSSLHLTKTTERMTTCSDRARLPFFQILTCSWVAT